MNARFWIFENCTFIKLTLRPGQRLEWGTGGPTDEGYAFHGFTVELVADTVVMNEWSNARDCDGRLMNEDTFECHVSRLAAEQNEFWTASGGRCPDWQRVDSSRRDEFAEAAGY